jgi:molybdopterin molybdotransferase
MISFDEAVALVGSTAKMIGREQVPLEHAAGRVLASQVVARIDSPRCDVSAMDGYAVRDSDLAAVPARLKIVGESFAGGGFDGEVGAGECVRIFTGAPFPSGADRVVIQENVRRDSDIALFETAVGSARHVRARGGDFKVGEVLLNAGRLLDARATVAAAAADISGVDVAKQPRVQILGTGDELVAPGTAAASANGIPESVSFGIAALVNDWGGIVVDRKHLRDDVGELERAAADAVGAADFVVVTGGASVGEKDFAKTMFEPLGLELVFSKVAMRPGKPVWLGKVGVTLVMGLPGNPTSALVTARLLLAPLLAVMTGRPIEEALAWRSAPLASDLPGCGSRETFHRARFAANAVEMLRNQDSSAQKVLAQANVLVRQRVNAAAVSAGELIEILDF